VGGAVGGNRLTAFEATGNEPLHFVHDALGRRVASYQAIDGPTNSHSVTLYAYSGIRVVQTAEYTATKSGGVFNLDASSEAVTSYIHGPGLDELLAMRRDGVTYLFITDVNHSVLAAVEADTGEVAEWYDYGDFGAPSIFDAAGAPLAASAIGNARLYTGAFWDAGMRLYHLRARYLDPDTGRFTQRDPLGPWGDPLALGNPTTYAANNPWTYTDPLGLCAGKDTPPSEGMSWLEKAKYAAHAAFDDYAVGMANWLFNSDGKAKGGLDGALDPAANAAAGYGDALTFGATDRFREGHGLNDFVDRDSWAYAGGGLAADATFLAAGVGAARVATQGQTAAASVQAARAPVQASNLRIGRHTETVQRAMSIAELNATRATGLIRGGRGGTHFVSNNVNSSASRAQLRLALPVRPEVRVHLQVPSGRFSAPSRVQPLQLPGGRRLPGGGMERSATGNIPVRITRVDPL